MAFDNWSVETLPGAYYATGNRVAEGNGVRVIVSSLAGAYPIATSIDGGEWLPVSVGSSIAFSSVGFIGDRFLAFQSSTVNAVYASTDGINWTPTLLGLAFTEWPEIVMSNGSGLVVAIDYGDSAVVVSTDYGQSWVRLTPFGTVSIYHYASVNGVFLLVDANKNVYRSVDGVSWSSVYNPTDAGASFNHLTAANGLFFAFSANGVATSSDGITWSTNVPYTPSYMELSYANGLYIGTNSGLSNIYTSVDGASFDAVFSIGSSGATKPVVGESVWVYDSGSLNVYSHPLAPPIPPTFWTNLLGQREAA